MPYRALKCESLRKIIEGRAGISNFTRVVRAAFIAAIMEDRGEKRVSLPQNVVTEKVLKKTEILPKDDDDVKKPPFVMCVNDFIMKGGMTHILFTRALKLIAGPIREPYLHGTLMDVRSDTTMVPPEGFPNSFVKGASSLKVRVGAYVEPAGGVGADGQKGAGAVATAAGATNLQVMVEPVIVEGASVFCGPIALRVIQNEGECREYVREISSDGSRSNWGPIFLTSNEVTTAKGQAAASGTIETSSSGKKSDGKAKAGVASGEKISAFNADQLHNGGYQVSCYIFVDVNSVMHWHIFLIFGISIISYKSSDKMQALIIVAIVVFHFSICLCLLFLHLPFLSFS